MLFKSIHSIKSSTPELQVGRHGTHCQDIYLILPTPLHYTTGSLSGNNSGQVVHTHTCASVTKQYKIGTGKNWEVSRDTTQHIGPISMVLELRLVPGWGQWIGLQCQQALAHGWPLPTPLPVCHLYAFFLFDILVYTLHSALVFWWQCTGYY